MSPQLLLAIGAGVGALAAPGVCGMLSGTKGVETEDIGPVRVCFDRRFFNPVHGFRVFPVGIAGHRRAAFCFDRGCVFCHHQRGSAFARFSHRIRDCFGGGGEEQHHAHQPLQTSANGRGPFFRDSSYHTGSQRTACAHLDDRIDNRPGPLAHRDRRQPSGTGNRTSDGPGDLGWVGQLHIAESAGDAGSLLEIRKGPRFG